MSQERINAIDVFSGTTVPYRSMWETIEARICALRKDDSFCLLSMRVFLTDEETSDVRILLDHPGLDVVMWVDKVEARYLDQLLLQLRDSSSLTFGSRVLDLEIFENRHWDCRRYSGRYRGYMGLDCPYVLLSTSGKSFGDVAKWSDLEAQLRRHGYSDLAHTSEENLGFPVGTSYSTQIALVAPIYLNFKTVEVEDNCLTISVESHSSVPLEDMTLSYEVKYEEEGKARTLNDRTIFVEDDIAERADRFIILSKRLNVNARIVEARIWLYDKWTTEPIDSAWVRQEAIPRESVAWRILGPLLEERHRAVVIDGHAKLREYLCLDYHDPTLGREFEVALSHLLGSMGFSVFFLGQPLPKKGIDIVAVCPDSSRTLLVSAHASNDIHEKLRTLVPEFHRLKDALQGVQLTPVLFSPVRIDDILASDRSDAEKHRVALVLNSQIEELFSIVGNLTPTEARRETLELIDRVIKEQSWW